VPARVLLTISVLTVGAGDVVLQHFTLATDTVTMHCQGLPGSRIWILLVPVNVLAYSQLGRTRTIELRVSRTFSELGRQFGIAFHHNGGRTPAPVPSNKSGLGYRRDSQQLVNRVTAADQLSRDEGFSGPDAATAAHAYLYLQLQHQVSLCPLWIASASLRG